MVMVMHATALSTSNPYYPKRIFYIVNLRPSDKKSSVHPYGIAYVTSDDNGETWSSIKTIFLSEQWDKDVLKGCWEPSVYKGLCAVLEECSNTSAAYNKEDKAFAVFDFDNTTIMNDVEYSLFAYIIENLKFDFSPEELHKRLIDSPVSPDFKLSAGDGRIITAGDLADDIYEAYKELYGKPLDEITNTDAYKDYRAKIRYMYDALDDVMPSADVSAWLFNIIAVGSTGEEIQALTRESTYSAIAKAQVKKDSLGRYLNKRVQDYPPTWGEGKTAAIIKYIAPLHGGKGPVRTLYNQQPKYLLQGRDSL
jgi:hypothetical protein